LPRVERSPHGGVRAKDRVQSCPRHFALTAARWLSMCARKHRVLGLLSLMTLTGSALPALAEPCDGVRPNRDLSKLPADYRRAVDAVIEATSRPGKPWSCTGGTIDVVPDSSGRGATLTIVDPTGRTARRSVEA